MNKLKRYKESNFDSWLEFVMCFGTTSFENGGYIVFIYGWGGITWISIMLILKINGWLC